MKIFAYALREYDEKKYMDQFSQELGFEYAYTSDYPSLENAELANGYDAVSTINNQLSAELIETWHNMGVKYIAGRCIGYDHMDRKKMLELGVRGVHAHYSPFAVANYTIMLMLMSCRNINQILKRSRSHDFSLKGNMGKELSISTVGIIGTGSIGAEVIKHLSGFGCKILAYDVHQNESVKDIATYVDLDTLYKESDIISLHVPGLASTHHIINDTTLAYMKDEVIIINAARGSVIDTNALIRGLESGKIAAAALDTFEEEIGMYYHNLSEADFDNEAFNKLQSFPNVILSPHMAFYTELTVSDMVRTTVEGLLAFEKGGDNPAEIPYED